MPHLHFWSSHRQTNKETNRKRCSIHYIDYHFSSSEFHTSRNYWLLMKSERQQISFATQVSSQYSSQLQKQRDLDCIIPSFDKHISWFFGIVPRVSIFIVSLSFPRSLVSVCSLAKYIYRSAGIAKSSGWQVCFFFLSRILCFIVWWTVSYLSPHKLHRLIF